jgi:hypothetical protein
LLHLTQQDLSTSIITCGYARVVNVCLSKTVTGGDRYGGRLDPEPHEIARGHVEHSD